MRLKGMFGIAALALLLLASLVMPLAAIPAQAHVPSGAGEVGETELTPIWIYAGAEELENLQKFVIEDNDVRGYKFGMEPIVVELELETDVKKHTCPDGELCVCEACVFRVMKLAISRLWPEDVPNQADFKITWTHPTPGHEKTFKYITGGAAEYHNIEVPGTSKKKLTLANYEYTFTNTATGETFETRVREGVFDGFFELRTKVKMGQATEAEKAEFESQFIEVREKFLTLEAGELFVVEEEEEEPTPVWPIVFTLGLTVVVIGTTVYSIVRGRR